MTFTSKLVIELQYHICSWTISHCMQGTAVNSYENLYTRHTVWFSVWSAGFHTAKLASLDRFGPVASSNIFPGDVVDVLCSCWKLCILAPRVDVRVMDCDVVRRSTRSGRSVTQIVMLPTQTDRIRKNDSDSDSESQQRGCGDSSGSESLSEECMSDDNLPVSIRTKKDIKRPSAAGAS